MTNALVKLVVVIQAPVPLRIVTALARSNPIKARGGEKGVTPECEQSCSV